MTKKYLEELSALLQQTTPGNVDGVNLACKHFFSGAAVYANGRICMSLTPAGFAIKLPEASRNALLKQKGSKELRYFPQGPIKKDYVVLPQTILNDVEVLRRWVKLCIESAASRPGPVRNKGG